MLGLPGGNAEEGESLETAIVRETAEETGLDVKPFGFGCDPTVETFTFANGDRCQYFVLNFFTRSFLGPPKVSDKESTAVDWFSTSQLPRMLPNMRRSVEAYVRFLQTGEFQMIWANVTRLTCCASASHVASSVWFARLSAAETRHEKVEKR